MIFKQIYIPLEKFLFFVAGAAVKSRNYTLFPLTLLTFYPTAFIFHAPLVFPTNAQNVAKDSAVKKFTNL